MWWLTLKIVPEFDENKLIAHFDKKKRAYDFYVFLTDTLRSMKCPCTLKLFKNTECVELCNLF